MIGVVIATFGDDTWRDRGRDLADQVLAQLVDGELVNHTHGTTLAEARNNGAARCAARSPGGPAGPPARWLCFLDADDALEPGYLPAMRRRIDELTRLYGTDHYRALLMPAVRYVRDGYEDPVATIPNGAPRRPLWEINRGVIGTLIDARSFFTVGGFRELPIYEDWDLWLRAVASGARVHEVVDAVYRVAFNPHGRNLTRDVDSTYWTIRKEHER